MDLQIIESIEKVMYSSNAGKSKRGMRALDSFMNSNDVRLKKEKVKAGTYGLRVIPLVFEFPFHPFELDNEDFNDKNTFKSEGSPSVVLEIIKIKMLEDEKLKEFYCKRGGLNPEEYKIVRGVWTEQDWRIFGKYRKLLHYSQLVNMVELSSFGKYGKKFASTAKYDDLGNVVEEDLAYRIHRLEIAFCFEKVNRISEEYDKSNKPEKDKKEAIKRVWKSMAVKEPYYLGSLRFLIIPTDSDYNFDKDAIKEINTDGVKVLKKYEVYGNGSRNIVTKLQEFLGKKTDVHPDYIAVGMGYPDTGSDNPLDIYNAKTYQPKFTKDEDITAFVTKFDEEYVKFRNDTEYFSEDVMLRSVREYKGFDDGKLYDAYRIDLGKKKELITKEIAKSHSNLLKEIGGEAFEYVTDGLLCDDLPEGDAKINIDDIPDDILKSDEHKKGFGLDEGDDNLNLDLED